MPGPRTMAVLRYFEFEHLPPRLQVVSRPVGELARAMADRLPEDHPQLLAGLHDLLRAKDCLVRAALDSPMHAPLAGVEVRK
jgi:hypothetical protein